MTRLRKKLGIPKEDDEPLMNQDSHRTRLNTVQRHDVLKKMDEEIKEKDALKASEEKDYL